MIEVTIQNIVASTIFAEKLDLDMIAQSLENAEYEPEQFPGLVYRLVTPKTATLLFRSGKANCTGAKTIDDVRKTVDLIAEKLRILDVDVYENLEIIVQNMVATADLSGELNLDEVAVAFGLENVEYETISSIKTSLCFSITSRQCLIISAFRYAITFLLHFV